MIKHIQYLIFVLLRVAEEFLYLVKAPGQQLTEAQTRTPLLGPTGPACTLSFDFALTGNLNHIGKWLNVLYSYLCFQKGDFFPPCGSCRWAVGQGDWQHAGHAVRTVGVHWKDGSRGGGVAAGQPDYWSQKTSLPGQPRGQNICNRRYLNIPAFLEKIFSRGK